MITKIISCADIHIPLYKGLDEMKAHLQKFIDKCEDIIDEEDGPENVRIVIAGDIVHNKIQCTNEQMVLVDWFFKELDKLCKTIVIAGNHDFLMNNMDRLDSLTPLFEIGSYKQVVYLDKELGYSSGVYEDDNVVWCLYSSFAGFNTPDITMHKASNEGKDFVYVGLVHGDINGSITVTNYTAENGLDPNIFEDCDFVIAGHIHKRQELKKNGVRIVYCSSIRQGDFGESVTGHGFILWDIEDPEEITYKSVDIKNEDGGYYKFDITCQEDITEDNEELINY